MKSQIIAEVVLRAQDGSSYADAREPVSTENIKQYVIDGERKREAHKKLTELGFNVVASGPFSLSITGSKEAFERIFRTRLQQESKTDESTRAHPLYSPLSPIIIPKELVNLVAAVTFPAAPELFP